MDALAPRESFSLGASPRSVVDGIWLERQTDAAQFNAFANHPDIYPHIRGNRTDALDFSAHAANRDNYFFCSAHGGVMFLKLMPGLYEMHTAVLPSGRGAMMKEGAAQAFYAMFTQSDCVEILTHCPQNNLAAKLGAKSVGMSLDWRVEGYYPVGKSFVSSDVYSLKVMEWGKIAWRAEAIGKWFHDELHAQYEAKGITLPAHPEDETHNKVVGAAIALIHGGQPIKGVVLYDRWAMLSGYLPAKIKSFDPLVIDIFESSIEIKGDAFEVLTCQQAS